MSCEVNFRADFACKCPLPRNIVHMHRVEAGASHCPYHYYYYLPQMRVCQMGARVVRVELSTPGSWGACFCRQYLEMQCQSVRLLHDNPFFSSTLSDEGPKEVFVEMRFQDSMLCMPAHPLCIGLTLVPIQRCVRRFLNYRQVLRQKALYWANAVTQMCARQSAAGQTLLPLHQIASNADLMCMILHAITQTSFKATPHSHRACGRIHWDTASGHWASLQTI
jgi:hypothetical protein